MIYTVTFNPAIDYYMYLENFRTDDVNKSDSEELLFGGKGINVSVVLSRLGMETKALGFLAGFTGEALKKMMEAENIQTDFIFLSGGLTRINVKVRYGEELDFNAKGPHISAGDTHALIEKLSCVQRGDVIVLSGSVPDSVPKDIYERISQAVQGRGAKIVVDAVGDLLLNVLKYKPFMIKPNHHELGDIFGVNINTLENVEKYGNMLREKGAVNVLVSMGKKGAALIDENGKLHYIGNVEGKIVNSVGCGDSMVAGFISGYEKTGDYAYALKAGAVCGNATAFSKGLATKEKIAEMQNRML